MIPPPIVQSIYHAPQRAPTETTVVERDPQADDRQVELEADLQFLLDAQADGLIRGLGGGEGETGDRSSAGSTTPTMQSIRSTSTRRMRKPLLRQPGLRSARKGIYKTIVALASLKDEELRDIDAELRGNQQTLEQIDGWETKHKGLREASHRVDGNEETIRIQRLRSEADSVQEEILKVELQLAEMRTKHRKLLKQAAAIENSVQAKMASYTSSLRMLEEDIQKFLNFKPSDEAERPTSREGKSFVWQLPPNRRNLGMAKEYWSEQHEYYVHQRKRTEHEKVALVEGASIWQESVTEITDFEKRLRAEMAALAPSLTESHSAWEEPPTSTASERLAVLIKQIDDLTLSLQGKLQTSQERNWKLLIVAIGAELDALERGKEILSGVLHDTDGDHDTKEPTNNLDAIDNGGELIDQLDKSFMTAQGNAGEPSDAEDDDHPNPELLFSKQEDTDTD
ncbi:uncharacterized protein RCC_06458 [Ramularia collo-cygni]|uniref:Autophagy-related protein 28 n=1 Tax=Ramularia collo-cygni TaxID=112498 RepID=A0A2D3V574_9PEZI|nr:uncharacterized protein RCC_06458 [Ramularia collo-cygni]CZT20600.1 uncharacterized protein RCC_06458 [Ramularia collo-cygni]